MDDVTRAWWHCGVAAVVLVVGIALGASTSQSQVEEVERAPDAGVPTFVERRDSIQSASTYLHLGRWR